MFAPPMSLLPSTLMNLKDNVDKNLEKHDCSDDASAPAATPQEQPIQPVHSDAVSTIVTTELASEIPPPKNTNDEARANELAEKEDNEQLVVIMDDDAEEIAGLESKTVKQLKDMAKTRGVNTAGMNKAAIVKALSAN